MKREQWRRYEYYADDHGSSSIVGGILKFIGFVVVMITLVVLGASIILPVIGITVGLVAAGIALLPIIFALWVLWLFVKLIFC